MGKYQSFIKMKGSTYDTTFYYQKGVGNIFKEKTSFRLKEKWNSLDPTVREKFAASQKNATNFDAIQKGIKYWKAYLQNLTKYATKQTHKQLFDFVQSMQVTSSDDYHKDIVWANSRYPQTLGFSTIGDILPPGASIVVNKMTITTENEGTNIAGNVSLSGADNLTIADLAIDWQKYDTITMSISPIVPSNIVWDNGQFAVNYNPYYNFLSRTYQYGDGILKLNRLYFMGSFDSGGDAQLDDFILIPHSTPNTSSIGAYLTIVASNSTDSTIAKKQYSQKLDYQFTIG